MQIVFNAVWRQTSCFFPCLQSFCKTKLLACYLLLHFWWIPDEFAGTINDYSYKVCTNQLHFSKENIGLARCLRHRNVNIKNIHLFPQFKKKKKLSLDCLQHHQVNSLVAPTEGICFPEGENFHFSVFRLTFHCHIQTALFSSQPHMLVHLAATA